MEIDVIRPLFKKYHIEDTLNQINEYIIEYYNREDKGSYKNIVNDFHELWGLTICYFGNYFTIRERIFISESLEIFVLDFIEKHNYNYKIIKKILFNKKLNYHCYASFYYKGTPLKPYHLIKITMFEVCYGYKSLYNNFISSVCERENEQLRCARRNRDYKYEYKFRSTEVRIDLTNTWIKSFKF